ncbi:MAG: hypothetical protein QOG85_643 [Gaiellaceae bacterium]|jgi:Tfp pilus assembly protein PilN|nr:hypothetical protein [Gaiellaceae bacterium]
MRAVNLLPRETSTRTLDVNSELSAAIAFTAVILVAVLGGFFLERSHVTAEKQRLASIQATFDKETAEANAKHTQLQNPDVLSQEQLWHVALDSALSTRMRWDVLLAQLEYVTPDRIRLTNVTFGSPPAATSAPGSSVTSSLVGQTVATVQISGNAYTLQDIAVYLSTLSRVPKLSQVRLVTSTRTKGSDWGTFQLKAQVILPTAPAPPVATTDTTTDSGGPA